MSSDNTTVETQVNESPDVTVNTEDTTVTAEPTVADLHKDVVPEKKKATEVPIARLNKEIEKRKSLENELAELKRVLDGDDSVEDVDDEPEVKKLAQKLEQIEEREARAQEREARAKLEATFQEHLNKALDKSPEYKGIVNVEVIKSLAFNPANTNKTYSQLLEEAYGNALTGRRTVETTTPRGGAKDTQLDRRRAETDTEYRREVLADPTLRKQYNEGLTDRVFR